MTALDGQIGGDHYKGLDPQPVEVILAWKLGYCEGNVIKYIARWKNKGGLVDLKKARQYLSILIEREETQPDPNLGLWATSDRGIQNVSTTAHEDQFRGG